MFQSRSFVSITLADLILRSAYQMGKTPLLPIYALALGAGDAYLGFIVSVSTLTGMVLKPLIGYLSDRSGRWIWLVVGTCFFAFTPLLYTWVQTPNQLFWIRLLHGTSTAIYGPVTLAYVAEHSHQSVAERLGWFGMARSAGYVIGPALAGILLLQMSPAQVFTVIGLLSSLAFIPVVLLSRSNSPKAPFCCLSVPNVKSLLPRLPSSLWISGGISAGLYIATYALRTFLPVHGISVGISVVVLGGFFSIQELTHLICKPWGGRLGDRWGYSSSIGLGLGILGISLLGLTQTTATAALLSFSILIGIGESLILPSSLALVGTQVDPEHLGVSMGWIGTMNNGGKVLGPVIAGVMIQNWTFTTTFIGIGVIACLLAGGIQLSPDSSSPQTFLSQTGGD